MSKHTDLIIKLITTRAAIEDSDILSKFGIIDSNPWSDVDFSIAIIALDELIKAAQIKKLSLTKNQQRYKANEEVVQRELASRKKHNQ